MDVFSLLSSTVSWSILSLKSLNLQDFHSLTVMRIYSTFSSKNTIKLLAAVWCQETSYLQFNDFYSSNLMFVFPFSADKTLEGISDVSWGVRRGKYSTYSPLCYWKRQLSRDMRFLQDWYEAGDPMKPVWQPLWNQLRCKRGDGGLSSERMPGNNQIHDDKKKNKNIIVIIIIILAL